MRTHGTLVKWNDDRGFGFIEPAAGMEEIFVHVSAFPHDGIRPRIGELVSFEIDLRQDGKKRAVRVMRPGASSSRSRHAARGARPAPRRSGTVITILSLLALGAAGWYGYGCSRRSAPRIRNPCRTRFKPGPWCPFKLSVATDAPAVRR
jgi:cold shock CspA family protein